MGAPRQEPYVVTTVGLSAHADRKYRMRFYTLSMTLRFVCVASLLFLRGPWAVFALIGAVVLPYLAVMVANAVGGGAPSTGVNAPDLNALPMTGPPDQHHAHSGAPLTIEVDAPAERRPQGERIDDATHRTEPS